MTPSRSWDMEIGRFSVENVTLGLRPRVTFTTSGSSYFHVPLTTVRHLLNVATMAGWQEIIAISCSWCKAAYHNKVSCFMMQQIEEPCLMGVHADVIMPPSWIIKLPQKVTS